MKGSAEKLMTLPGANPLSVEAPLPGVPPLSAEDPLPGADTRSDGAPFGAVFATLILMSWTPLYSASQ